MESSSVHSNDSDPVLINHSTADLTNPINMPNDLSVQPTQPGPPEQTQSSDDEVSPRPPALTRASTFSTEKCWICLSTRDEDPPSPPNPPTAWRSPCKCSLTAHEACLLDWVADQEAPRSRNGGGRSNPTPDTILCPQCKSEIKIKRPIDPLVQLCRRIDRAYSRFVLPGLAGGLVGMITAGCWVHGHIATYLVFGPRDAELIYTYTRHHSIGYELAYALIPINLIFARTRWAEYILPTGQLFLLAQQLESTGYELNWTSWPPLPSTVFACLPLIKTVYDWTYQQLFAELNQKWIKEVQPNREEGYDGHEDNIADILNEQEAQMAADDDGTGADIVLEVELNMGTVDEEDVQLAVNEATEAAERDIAARAENEDGAPAPDVGGPAEAQARAQQQGQVRPQERGHVHRLLGDNELIDDTSSIGQSALGALMLPIAASVTGDLLKLVLPSSWTTPSVFSSVRPGLLSTKWGRSVVGGLLFVGMKDMLVLYCRWRLAQGHKNRTIMNYDKAGKKYVAADR